MRDAEHVAWVKLQRDPELWHVAAIAMLTYLGDPRGFLLWLFDQPEMDRATAGYLFLGANGREYLCGRTEFNGEGLAGQDWLRTIQAICRRDANGGFTHDTLGLHPGFEAERQACLALVDSGRVADGIVVPRTIQYFIEDGAVLDYNPGAS